MKDQYPLIVALKRIDVCLQLLCFAFITIVVVFYQEDGTFAVGLSAICICQVFSAVFWLFTLRREPNRMSTGIFIRVAWVIVCVLMIAIYALYTRWKDYGLALIVAYILMIVGPVLIGAYFLITIAEIHNYKKLARKG